MVIKSQTEQVITEKEMIQKRALCELVSIVEPEVIAFVKPEVETEIIMWKLRLTWIPRLRMCPLTICNILFGYDLICLHSLVTEPERESHWSKGAKSIALPTIQ
jgi:hypothetical protein